MIRQPGILLLGPTGSGKTPLGDRLQIRDLWGRRCHHFDFGVRLRDVAYGIGIAVQAGPEIRAGSDRT